jgi:hypothetical protein
MEPVGVSTGGAPSRGSSPMPARAVPSPLPTDYKGTLARVDAQRFVAEGHAGGRFDADVYVTPSAKDAAFGLPTRRASRALGCAPHAWAVR